jgi:hypothetical protein
MTRIIRTIILGAFLLPCFLVGSENAPSEAQKKQCEADAQRYRAMVTALGGKFADSDHAHDQKKTEPQPSQSSKKLLDQPSKL